MDGSVNGLIEGWTDGLMVGLMNGWMDKCKDGFLQLFYTFLHFEIREEIENSDKCYWICFGNSLPKFKWLQFYTEMF